MTKARFGRIINISSVVGSMGNAGQSNYAAAKAGMEGYSRALASELGSRGITVNCVAPGFIATDMTEALSQEQREQLLARVQVVLAMQLKLLLWSCFWPEIQRAISLGKQYMSMVACT